MSNYLFYFTPVASLIAFLVSLTIFLQPPPQRFLKYFTAFLFVNFLLEAAENYSAFYAINNVFLNNVSSILIASFYLFLLREIVHGKRAKKVVLVFVLAYLLVSMINIFLVQTSRTFQSMTYSFSCLLIVTACIYYFWELFQLKSSVNLVRQPSFWICSGLLFYYACTFPILGMFSFVNALPNIILQNLFQIFILLSIFLYLSFTIAFLCRLKTRKSM